MPGKGRPSWSFPFQQQGWRVLRIAGFFYSFGVCASQTTTSPMEVDRRHREREKGTERHPDLDLGFPIGEILLQPTEVRRCFSPEKPKIMRLVFLRIRPRKLEFFWPSFYFILFCFISISQEPCIYSVRTVLGTLLCRQ